MSHQEADFVTGRAVLKYSKSERPTQRILSLKEDCLIWHKTRRRRMPRRLRLLNVMRINLCCSTSNSESGCDFTVETAFKTYKFQAETEAVARRWVDELRRKVKSAHMREDSPTNENDSSTDSALQDTRDEELQSDKCAMVVSKVQKILKKCVGMPIPADNLVECFGQVARSRKSLITDLHGVAEERHSQFRLSNHQENLIKSQLSSLEAKRAAQGANSLDGIRETIVSQQFAGLRLTREREDLLRINTTLIEEERELKSKLETACALSHNLERLIAKETKLAQDTKVVALQRGFQGYICSFAAAEIRDQINLTPRRPTEDGVYKKRHISVSQGNNVLVWKAIGLFVQKNAALKFSDVERTRDGSPDVIRLQPFPGFVYLTLYSSNLTLVIAVEPQLSFYLDAIKQLHLTAHNKSARNIPECSQITLLRSSSAHLTSQASMYKRLLTRYNTNLEVRDRQESICETAAPCNAIDGYFEEVRHLRELCASGVAGYLSEGAEDYTRKERAQLEQRLLNLSAIVVKVADYLN